MKQLNGNIIPLLEIIYVGNKLNGKEGASII